MTLVALFFFTLYFYLRTLCATFNINDSGETILDCDQLAIAHSPGYPLHSLLGRIACLFPLGQPMFRLTTLSAIWGALAVTGVYYLIQNLLRPRENEDPWSPRLAAFCGALFFAFSYQQWFQSCGAKGSIYSLNTLFTVLTVAALWKAKEKAWRSRGLALAFFLVGAAMSVHWETQMVLMPAYLYFGALALDPEKPKQLFRTLLRPFDLVGHVRDLFAQLPVKQWIQWGTFFFIPLSAYLYLPLRAAQNPLISWWDPQTLGRFLFVVLRKNYEGGGEPDQWLSIHRNLSRFWLHAHDQYGTGFTFVLLALAVLGWVNSLRTKRADIWGFTFLGAGVLGGVVFYNKPLAGYEWTLDNFFTPVFLTIALFAALGIHAGLQWFHAQPRLVWARPLFIAAAFLIAFLPLGLNYNSNDQSIYTASYEEGINLLKTTDRNGIILCNGDIDILPLWYLQFVEGKRPDVASLTTQLLAMDWYREDVNRHWPFLKNQIEGAAPAQMVVENMFRTVGQDRPFYTTQIFPQGVQWLYNQYALVPEGLLMRILLPEKENNFLAPNKNDLCWATYHLENLNPPERKYWDDYTDVMRDSYGQACSIAGDYAMAKRQPEVARWNYEKALNYHQPQLMGMTYLKLGDSELALSMGAEAINHYQQAIQWEPHSTQAPYVYAPYAYSHLGFAFLLQKDYDEAEQAFRLALRINPNEKEASAGLEQVERLKENRSLKAS